MAGASLFALIDDIAALLDDVAVMTKVAAKKTAGVVGDDLALNANQVHGLAAARELPVIWAVAKGSLVNKVILVPVAILLSVFASGLIKPLLMLGGAYLCYEGVHKLLHSKDATHVPLEQPRDPVDEKAKIRGAIRTDFILSAEIIVIALGTIPLEAELSRRIAVLAAIGVGITVMIYGVVALIVKIDDAGLLLLTDTRENGVARMKRALGRGLVGFAPRLMKLLSIAGTVAMFLVGGEIILHGIPNLELPAGVLGTLAALVGGVLSGLIVLGLVTVAGKLAGLVRRPA